MENAHDRYWMSQEKQTKRKINHKAVYHCLNNQAKSPGRTYCQLEKYYSNIIIMEGYSHRRVLFWNSNTLGFSCQTERLEWKFPTARGENTRERPPPDKPENRSLAPNTAGRHASSALVSKWTCLSARRHEESCYRHVTCLEDRNQQTNRREKSWTGCRTGTGALVSGGCLCVCRQRSLLGRHVRGGVTLGWFWASVVL